MVTAQAVLLLALSAPGDAVLLDFTSQRCPPCRAMEPIVQRLVSAGYPIRRIDIDQEPQVARRYRVSSIPCFVLISGNQEVDRAIGAVSYQRLVGMFAAARPAGRRRSLGGSARQQVRGQSPSGWGEGLSLPNPLDLLKRKDSVEPEAAGPPPSDPFTEQQSRYDQGSDNGSSTQSSAVERALAATVRLKVDDPQGHSYGTGTIIDVHNSEALVVTCGHIFRDSAGKGGIQVDVFHAGTARAVSGNLISYDLDRDIALVSISTNMRLKPAPVGSSGSGLQPGDRVYSIGCDHGQDPSVRHSHIASLNKYLGPPNIVVAGQPVDGRSGGGLFTAGGALIGICNCADPADNEGIYAGLATIHEELDRIGQRRIYTSTRVLEEAVPIREPLVPVADAPPSPQPASRGGLPNDTEVICIVRSKSDPQAQRKLLIVSTPSRQLLERLQRESQSKRTTDAP